jgi:hypothetical protein
MRTHTLLGPFLDYNNSVDFNMTEWAQLTGRYPSVVASYMGWDEWSQEGGIGPISPHDTLKVAQQLKEYGVVHVLNLMPIVNDENKDKVTLIELSPDLDKPAIPGQDVTKRQFLDQLIKGYNEIGTPVILNIGHEHQWADSCGGVSKYPSGVRAMYDYVQQVIADNPGGSAILGYHPVDPASLWPIG